MKRKLPVAFLLCLLAFSSVSAQEAEVKITLDEDFFAVLLEAVFENLEQPKVPLSLTSSNARVTDSQGIGSSYLTNDCDQSVRLKKQMDGVKTAVKFRGGKIYAPIAFDGNYDAYLLGCIGFSGWAETQIDLAFQKSNNALVGKVKVLNVNLSGTNGVGSSIVARLVQNSIDKKINPLKIIEMDKLSFTAPVQQAGKLRMEAVGMRHQVRDREIDIYLKYRFGKAK